MFIRKVQFVQSLKRIGAVALLTVLMMGSGVRTMAQVDQTKTPEGQLITLRNALEKAQTDAEKKKLLKEIGQTGTFIGLTTVAPYMKEKALKKVAAQAVAEIALSHKEYNGTNTRNWLGEAMGILGGKQRKAILDYLQNMPSEERGFVSIFNGKDLSGWKGLVENPITRAKMSHEELAAKQVKADEIMNRDWKVQDGMIVYVGHSFENLCTVRPYGNFEMYVDWKLDPSGKEPDAGIYLRGTPQVQIWDIKRVNVGAQVGSGGLYNNQKNPSKPTQVADNKLGEWNSFYIKMVGDRVTVKLNGVLVVDNVILENYWDRKQAIFPVEQIELQAHGSLTYFRDIYVRDIR
ncbi:MAG: DUF1080 domain-containing protein [Bacteroidaceae bacterium]|nr:DUF1080 domain-containing protein [Bacteroidaceae bacterium]